MSFRGIVLKVRARARRMPVFLRSRPRILFGRSSLKTSVSLISRTTSVLCCNEQKKKNKTLSSIKIHIMQNLNKIVLNFEIRPHCYGIQCEIYAIDHNCSEA